MTIQSIKLTYFECKIVLKTINFRPSNICPQVIWSVFLSEYLKTTRLWYSMCTAIINLYLKISFLFILIPKMKNLPTPLPKIFPFWRKEHGVIVLGTFLKIVRTPSRFKYLKLNLESYNTHTRIVYITIENTSKELVYNMMLYSVYSALWITWSTLINKIWPFYVFCP